MFGISIHSLRVEGDPAVQYDAPRESISIHSLRVEGDGLPPVLSLKNEQFQSTPSVWRETIIVHCHHLPPRHFNPLPPCGGRLAAQSNDGGSGKISIHSLRVEGDRYIPHTLRRSENFNPLPPCGGRRAASASFLLSVSFQSTPSVWRETEVRRCDLHLLSNFNPLPPCGGRRLFFD